jgi:putative PIN family toxin of toxin-antitoxin system
MTRAVILDTIVLVSGILTSDPAAPTSKILDEALAGQVRIVLSVDLLAEYRAVLLRPAILRRHGLSETEVDNLLSEITALAAFREVQPVSEAERRKDVHLLRLQAAAPEAILVTGDERLRAGVPPGIKALSPRAFLSRRR